MLDPFPFSAPAPIHALATRVANVFSLPTLPNHAHEVLFALGLYTFVNQVFSPWISTKLYPQKYPNFNKRTKISWDVHVVSFVQSCIINTMSLYVILFDEERKSWRPAEEWEMRIWGYDGMSGMLQSFALGYFLWDLYMCSRYVKIFGWGMLAHAMSAVTVFSLGFRPFLYFYAPVFLLYELSSPFLNIHWFCDKLDLTGSIYQAINGAFLTGTFFACRLCWGTYASVLVFRDVRRAITTGYSTPQYFADKVYNLPNDGYLDDVQGQTTAFMEVRHLPLWLGASYLTSNIVLNLLNFFWFSKMVQTVRSRFDPPFGTKSAGQGKAAGQPVGASSDGKRKGSVTAARERAEAVMNGSTEPLVQRSIDEDGHRGIEVSGTATRRSTRSRRKA